MRVTFIRGEDMTPQKFKVLAPLFEPVVREAARGEFTVEDIERMAREGRVITGLAESDEGRPLMAMAFEFVHYPRTLGVNVLALGGADLEEVAAMYWQTFRGWCRTAGADFIEASCSRAVARMLQKHGFGSVYQVVRAPL